MQDFKWYDAVAIALASNVILFLAHLILDCNNIIDVIVSVVGCVFARRLWMDYERFRVLLQSFEKQNRD
mgnify:CR=1 FL=1